MPPWCAVESQFAVKNLDYIRLPEQTSLDTFSLGIGMMDFWGNPHLFLNLGEDTTKLYKSAISRASDIGAKSLFITDFINLGEKQDVLVFDRKTYAGCYNIPEWDLKNVVSEAKKRDIKRTILLTNLSDTQDEVEGFLESAKKDKDVKEQVVGALYKKITSKNIAWTDKNNLKKYTQKDWETFLANLKQSMVQQATKAQSAGVTDFIINPGDVIIDYLYPGNLSNYWAEVAWEVRKVFSWKIGFFGYPDILERTELSGYDFVVVYFEVHADKRTGKYFAGLWDNVSQFTGAFQKYFSLPFWNKITKEKILLVTIPSYDGVKTEGWIEPGKLNNSLTRDDTEQAMLYEALFEANASLKQVQSIISYWYWWSGNMYPQSKPLRNDLSHSIRGKDAESVFYSWAKK